MHYTICSPWVHIFKAMQLVQVKTKFFKSIGRQWTGGTQTTGSVIGRSGSSCCLADCIKWSSNSKKKFGQTREMRGGMYTRIAVTSKITQKYGNGLNSTESVLGTRSLGKSNLGHLSKRWFSLPHIRPRTGVSVAFSNAACHADCQYC